MNSINPWEYNNGIPPGFQPPPLMAVPMFTPAPQAPHFRPFLADSGNPFNPGVPNVGLSPPYAAISSPFFTNQVPPPCLPQLRLPPLTQGQGQSWNPYVAPRFAPTFGPIFNAMLDEIRLDSRQMAMGVKEFRSLPLNGQLDQFLYARTLSAEQVRIRWQLVLDILFILRQEYPACEVHAFGSLISGLGDVSSDIDIYVDLLGPNTSTRLSSLDALHQTKRVFKKQKCPHTNVPFHSGPVIPVTHARVPVLKMKHLGSLISFDLTFENRLSAQNSKLLVFYTNMDPRVFRFMVIIRYWLKFHQLCSSNDIKNYALVLLILVYLMQKGIIPPVYLLQKLKETQRKVQSVIQNPDEIDGWDASFCEDHELIHKHFNVTPLPSDFHENPTIHLMEMALEFFTMCAHIDFGSVVVCPLLGEIILKGGFIPRNEVFLTDMLGRYKNFVQDNNAGCRLRLKSGMCIQDPFVLNFNVSGGTPLSTIIKFQIAAAKTVEVLTSKLREHHNGKTISLMDLFTPLPNHMRSKDLHKSYRASAKRTANREEILGALGLEDQLGEKTEEIEQQNKYVKLPRHLASMDKLLDQESYQKWQKENISSDRLVQMTLHQQQFTSHFFTEVSRCRLIKPDDKDYYGEMLKLVRKLTSLWKGFTLDFLDEFFMDALKLSIVGQMTEASVSVEMAEVNELCGVEGRLNWKIPIPDNRNRPKQGSDERKNNFKKAIEEIECIKEDEESYYRSMSVQVSYPFWNRPFLLAEWKEGENKIVAKSGKVEYMVNPIQVEGLISDRIQKTANAKGAGKRQEEREEKENVGDDQDVQILADQPKNKRARTDKDSFVPFKIDILVKVMTSLGDTHGRIGSGSLATLERPQMTLIFQSEETGQVGQHFRSATAKLSTLLNCMYPAYQMYRMDEWMAKAGVTEKRKD